MLYLHAFLSNEFYEAISNFEDKIEKKNAKTCFNFCSIYRVAECSDGIGLEFWFLFLNRKVII